MKFPKCQLSVGEFSAVLLCFSVLQSLYEELEVTLDKISKWICTTVSSEIGMKPEEALTTDGISTPLYGIQNVGWKLHKDTRRGPVLCYLSLTHKHTHAHTYSGQTWWPASDLDITGHAALWVPTGHIVSKCHNPDGGLKTC